MLVAKNHNMLSNQETSRTRCKVTVLWRTWLHIDQFSSRTVIETIGEFLFHFLRH